MTTLATPKVGMFVGDDEPWCGDPNCEYCIEAMRRRDEADEEAELRRQEDEDAERAETAWEIDNER